MRSLLGSRMKEKGRWRDTVRGGFPVISLERAAVRLFTAPNPAWHTSQLGLYNKLSVENYSPDVDTYEHYEYYIIG